MGPTLLGRERPIEDLKRRVGLINDFLKDHLGPELTTHQGAEGMKIKYVTPNKEKSIVMDGHRPCQGTLK